MKLSSLLKAAAGQLALSSPLGRWAQAVSAAAEAASGLFTVTRRINSAQSFNAAGDVVLNNIANDGGIDYDPATGLYSLKAGNLYSLQFYGFWKFGTPATDNVIYNWYDVGAGGTLPGGGGAAASLGNGADDVMQPVASTLYRPTVDTTVKVRVLLVTGVANLQPSSYAIVRQVG